MTQGTDPECIAQRQLIFAQAAANAKEGFLDHYFDAEVATLLQEFITVNSSDSKAIFAIKYKLDAVMLIRNGVDSLASSVEFYQQEYQKIKTGR